MSDEKKIETRPGKPGYVNQITLHHNSEKDFWKKHKEECCQIRSVKEVYQRYIEWTKAHDRVIQNEYRFRTFIRKNGYNNGGDMVPKKKVKKDKKSNKSAELNKSNELNKDGELNSL